MRFVFFFVIATLILLLIYTYTGWRLIAGAQIKPGYKLILWLIVFAFLAILMMQFFLRWRMANFSGMDILAWAGYLALGFFVLTFSLLVLRDIFYLLALGSSKVLFYAQSNWVSLPAKLPGSQYTRELFSIQTLNKWILAVSISATFYGLYESHRLPKVKEVQVAIQNLPLDLVDLKIVQLTDLHVGPTLHRNFVEKVVQRVNELEPDIIALTGDLADGSVRNLGQDVRPLAKLKSRYGKFFVTGNHEYYSGVGDWLDEVKTLGFQVLNNENVVLKIKDAQMVMAGVTDYSAGSIHESQRSDPERAIRGAGKYGFKILLAHQPKSIFAAQKAGFQLQLSGHTHGGQFFPWNFFVGWEQPYVYGLHKYKDTWIYVSRGTGYWGPPMRLAAPSEITLIRLKRQ